MHSPSLFLFVKALCQMHNLNADFPCIYAPQIDILHALQTLQLYVEAAVCNIKFGQTSDGCKGFDKLSPKNNSRVEHSVIVVFMCNMSSWTEPKDTQL